MNKKKSYDRSWLINSPAEWRNARWSCLLFGSSARANKRKDLLQSATKRRCSKSPY